MPLLLLSPTQQEPANKTNTDTPPALPPVANVSSNTEAGAEAPEQEQKAEATGTPELSTSQRVWNRAYDELAKDAATSDLVEAYVKILPKATDPDGSASAPAGDGLPTEMSDPVRRQTIMKDAIKAGQVKIAKVAKVTNAVGDVVNFVNQFKGVDRPGGVEQSAGCPAVGWRLHWIAVSSEPRPGVTVSDERHYLRHNQNELVL